LFLSSLAHEDKKNNIKVRNVPAETLSILPEVQNQSLPSISEVQYVVPFDDGGLEDIFKRKQGDASKFIFKYFF
jgi:hypothetical protein